MKTEQLPRDVLLRALGFDLYKTSSAHEAGRLLDLLLEEVRATGRRQRLHAEKVRVALETVVLNLFTAWQHDADVPLVHYSRDRTFYPGTRVSYDTLIDTVIPCLEEDLNYIQTWKNLGGGLEARMRATPKLIGLFRKYKISLNMVRSAAGLEFRGPKVQRGERKWAPRVSLPPERSDLQRLCKHYSDNLVKINQVLQDNFIGLLISDDEFNQLNARLTNSSEDYDDDGTDRTPPKSPVDFTRKTLRRVFNNVVEDNPSLDKGGRFAGAWWQNIPSEYRAHIWINDEPGFELDFSSMEPAIAYADTGLDVRDFMKDPYIIPEVGEQFRKITKRILVIMLNCETRDKALGAARKYVLEEHGGCLPDGCPPVEELVSLHERQHSSLDFYVRDEGLRRMFRESSIAERVMLKFAEQGIPVLPIHDSFIVPASCEASLEFAMYEAFSEEMSQGCRVTCEHEDWLPPNSIFWDYHTEDESGVSTWPSRTPDNVVHSEYSIFFRLRDDHYRKSKVRKRA